MVSHFPLHVRFLRLKFFLLLLTWEELSIVEDKRSPDRWGWEAAVVSHRERNIVWNYCLLYLDCSSMTVWDLNDWQMMSSKTNRVMTKQAATGNNIGLVGDFRHGNNQLQTYYRKLLHWNSKNIRQLRQLRCNIYWFTHCAVKCLAQENH